MYAGALPSIRFADDIERMRRAEEQRHIREFVALLRRLTPELCEFAEYIETSWYQAPEEVQDAALSLANKLKSKFITTRSAPKSLTERFRSFVIRLRLIPYESEIRDFGLAASRYLSAVNRSIGDESRRRAIADSSIAESAEAQSIIKAGDEEFAAGRGTRYSQTEFEKRFNYN